MPKKKKNKTPMVTRERVVNEDVPQESRRLDSLANLLAVDHSICVATCVINGKL